MGYALENMSASGVEVNEEIRIAAGATIAQVAVRVFNLDHYEKRRHCTDCRRAYQGAKVVMETLGIVVPVRPVPVESKKTTRAARSMRCSSARSARLSDQKFSPRSPLDFSECPLYNK
jgi:hypothetical protein